MPKFIYKANNDAISFCQFEGEPASTGSQMDCPWCGCGWLMTCTKCGKGFTFAEVRHTDTPLDVLYRSEIERLGLGSVPDEDVAEWVEAVEAEFERFEIGQKIVYLDGEYFAVDSENVEFEGLFAKHTLKTMPHADDMKNPGIMRETFMDRAYWYDRELPDRE